MNGSDWAELVIRELYSRTLACGYSSGRGVMYRSRVHRPPGRPRADERAKEAWKMHEADGKSWRQIAIHQSLKYKREISGEAVRKLAKAWRKRHPEEIQL
jgi:hypothetical protein